MQYNSKKMSKQIGLPFSGSKKRVQKDIFNVYKYINPNWTNTPFIDLFAGGGAIGLYFATQGVKDITMNCYPEGYANALKTILNDGIDLKKIMCTREEFFAIDKNSSNGIDVLKRLVNSFGNNERSYLYSKEVSEVKYNLAIEIIKNYPNDWGRFRQTQTYKEANKLRSDNKLQGLEQLGRIQQLERIQQLDTINNINITSLDYKLLPINANAFYYLDPPYFNCGTGGYPPIDFNEFISWIKDNNIKGLLSHYEDDRLTNYFGKFQPLGHKSKFKTKKGNKEEGYYLINLGFITDCEA